MNLKNNILHSFDLIPNENYLEKIKFFESNPLFFLLPKKQDIDDISDIYIDYIFALYEKSSFSKIIEFIQKIEKLEVVQEYRFINKEFNEELRFYMSASLYNLKRFKEAKLWFYGLVKDYPLNENYPNWLKDSKYAFRNQVLTKALYLSAGFMLLIMIIRYFNFNIVIKPISRISEGAFIISLILFYLNLWKKKL